MLHPLLVRYIPALNQPSGVWLLYRIETVVFRIWWIMYCWISVWGYTASMAWGIPSVRPHTQSGYHLLPGFSDCSGWTARTLRFRFVPHICPGCLSCHPYQSLWLCHSLLHNMPFITYMVMDCIREYDCVNPIQRAFLLFFYDKKYLAVMLLMVCCQRCWCRKKSAYGSRCHL